MTTSASGSGAGHPAASISSGSPGDQARNSIGASRWTTTGRHSRRPAASSAAARASVSISDPMARYSATI